MVAGDHAYEDVAATMIGSFLGAGRTRRPVCTPRSVARAARWCPTRWRPASLALNDTGRGDRRFQAQSELGCARTRPSSTRRLPSLPAAAITPPASPNSAWPTTSARARCTTTSGPKRICSPPFTTGSWTRSCSAPIGWPRQAARRREQLAMLGDELLDVIHRYPDHVWVFLHEFPALTGERADKFRERRRAYEQRVEAILQAGVDSGEFRHLEPRLTAHGVARMHNYTYLWLKPGGELSARDVAKPFADIFMQGIANPAGRASPHRGTAPSRRRVAAVDDERRAGRPAGRIAGQVGVRARRGRRPCRARGDARAAMASSASGGRPSWMAERNVPGQTQLTRMPSRAYSTAATLAS